MPIFRHHNSWRGHHMARLLALLCCTWLAQACELTADEDAYVVPDDQYGTVVSCFAEEGRPVAVNVSRSVPYSSSATQAFVDNARVTLTVGQSEKHTGVIANGNKTAIFDNARLRPGQRFYLTVETDSRVLTAETYMPSVVPMERLDTVSTTDGRRLRITLMMHDDAATDDYYQAEVRCRNYRGGVALDTVLPASYTDYLFQSVAAMVGSHTVSKGLFDDTKYASEIYHPRFSVLWSDVWKCADVLADSSFLAVRLYHHTPDLYTFLQTSLQSLQYALLPVFGSTTVHSNIRGGYGIASGLVYDEKMLKINRLVTGGNENGEENREENGEETGEEGAMK